MASRPASHVACVLVALAVTASPALATWSVIAVDQQTRTLVIASATCVPQAAFAHFPAKGLMDVQAIVEPGKGVAAAQAGVDRTRNPQQLVYDEIGKGTDPNAKGGDRRCTCESRPPPAATAACERKTSHVAYILRADPTDRTGASFNQGQYGMYVSVTNDDIAPSEPANPVKTLRMRYDAWTKAHPR